MKPNTAIQAIYVPAITAKAVWRTMAFVCLRHKAGSIVGKGGFAVR
jgi:hypothetical protein